MKIKMNDKVISIPPYVSTSWSNVQSLHVKEGGVLVFSLIDGTKVEIPALSEDIIQSIFDMHVKVSGGGNQVQNQIQKGNVTRGRAAINIPLGLDIEGMENLGSMMQHNPQNSNSPDLPPEVLRKVAGIANVIGDDEMGGVPQPEHGCNCFYCQVVRAIHSGIGDLREDEIEEEEVSDDELTFRDWEIKQLKDNLYEVINPLDPNEKYQVYLGEPLGCTCGNKNCEHIKAVLES